MLKREQHVVYWAHVTPVIGAKSALGSVSDAELEQISLSREGECLSGWYGNQRNQILSRPQLNQNYSIWSETKWSVLYFAVIFAENRTSSRSKLHKVSLCKSLQIIISLIILISDLFKQKYKRSLVL